MNKEVLLEEVRPKLKGLLSISHTDSLVEQLAFVLKLYNTERSLPIKKVTTLLTLCKIFKERKSIKQCLPEVQKVLTFYMSVPISSTTAERIFSVMHRIKSWLRSTMSANSLNSRMFAAIQKERIHEVGTESIAKA